MMKLLASCLVLATVGCDGGNTSIAELRDGQVELSIGAYAPQMELGLEAGFVPCLELSDDLVISLGDRALTVEERGHSYDTDGCIAPSLILAEAPADGADQLVLSDSHETITCNIGSVMLPRSAAFASDTSNLHAGDDMTITWSRTEDLFELDAFGYIHPPGEPDTIIHAIPPTSSVDEMPTFTLPSDLPAGSYEFTISMSASGIGFPETLDCGLPSSVYQSYKRALPFTLQ